ncbi:MaoC/PaaZ C-terminal domain-containing protein [Glaciecola sp. SC05]|uniref:MaoC/PaaZ C-terminal domain-containing protein n=1 Tax=Glaciecola sp. SC05 TaxID=1987355 RepID=UPI00352962EB
MLGMLAKAAIYRPPESVKSAPTLPQQIESRQHEILPAHCENYHRLVQWPLSGGDRIHPNYVQVLTLPMQLNMMTKFPFPFKALGLVHVANKINVLSLPSKAATLDLNTYFGDHYSHPKGVVFELHSEASQNGVVAVKATSYYMARTKKTASASLMAFEDKMLIPNVSVQQAKNSLVDLGELKFEENSGRQYAKVSGDYNPIHLWPATSKLFGFDKAIAHGMYSHALCISKMQAAQHCDFSQNRSIKAVFKRPISLPNCAKLSLNHDIAQCSMNFSLQGKGSVDTAEKSRPHIIGYVAAI